MARPEDYLRWIVKGPNELREDIKFSARHWLQAPWGAGNPMGRRSPSRLMLF
jgi:hypothetical protein